MYGSSQNTRTRSTSVFQVSPHVFAALTWAMSLCFAVAALAAAYLLWGIFAGHLADWNTFPADEKTRLGANLHLGAMALGWSAGAGALCAAVAYLTEEAAGYALVFGAAMMGLGIPFLLARLGGSTLIPETNAALRVAVSAFPNASLFPAIIAALLITRDVIMRLIAAFTPQERFVSNEEQRFGSAVRKFAPTPRKSSPLPGQCWTGTYCRENIKVHCPVFQSKTPCWKQKKGCYCDESIVTYAASKINGINLPVTGATGRFNFSPESVMKVGGEAPQQKKTLTEGEKRERCRNCAIYNEHQQKKYNLIMPLTVATSVGAWVLLITAGQGQVNQLLGGTLGLLERFSFNPGSTVHQAHLSVPEVSPIFFWSMVIAFGIIVLSKILETLEWALFKLKI